jgi:hypothetical protein
MQWFIEQKMDCGFLALFSFLRFIPIVPFRACSLISASGELSFLFSGVLSGVRVV